MGAGEVIGSRKTDSESLSPKTIVIDRAHKTALLDGERYAMSDHEIKILELLCERSGTSVSRDELNRLVGATDGNIVDVYICRLRKKLEKSGERKVIYTVRGAGYLTKYLCVEK